MGGGGSSSSGGGSNRGGTRGDGGGRAANNGGMSGGASRGGSNRGGGGGGRASSSGGLGGGGSNSASPGRSTPGSPGASDGNRGSTMGPGGGSAPGSGSSSSGGRPTNPAASDRGTDTGVSRGGSSSSDRSESIAGSTDARFSFNSDSAGSMTSLGNSDSGFGFGGNSFRASRSPSMPGRNSSFGVTNGAVTGGLDTTTEGYKTIVGDGELSDSERAREARMAQLDNQRAPDTISAQQSAVDNTNSSFADRTKMPGVGLLQTIGAIGRNAMLGQEVAAENNAMVADRNLSPATLNADASDISAAYNSASLSDTTGGLLGNAMAPGQAAVGDYSAPTPNAPRGGDTSSGGINEYIPPQPQPQPQSRPNTPRGPYYGQINGYGSYARQFFSRV